MEGSFREGGGGGAQAGGMGWFSSAEGMDANGVSIEIEIAADRTMRPQAFDLDQGRYAVLVDEEMVEGPPRGAGLFIRNSELSRDEQPPARRTTIDLIASENRRMGCKKLLQQLL